MISIFCLYILAPQALRGYLILMLMLVWDHMPGVVGMLGR
jgi:hypothetical protein